MMGQGRHYAVLALSLFMLSTAPILVKLASIHALPLLAWRLLIVALFLLPFVCWKKSLKINLADAYRIFFVSAFLVAHFYTWFRGIPLLPISVATIIYASNPIFTAVIGHFILREKFYPRYFIALLFSFLGIYLTVRPELQTADIHFTGLLYMIATSFFYSGYMTLSKKMRLGLGNSQYNFYLNFFGSILTIIILTIVNLTTNQSNEGIYWHSFTLNDWGVILGLAIFPSLLGHTLMINTIAYLNLNFVSIFKLLNPLISSALAFLIFHERMRQDHWLGFMLVICGVLVSLDLTNLLRKITRRSG